MTVFAGRQLTGDTSGKLVAVSIFITVMADKDWQLTGNTVESF